MTGVTGEHLYAEIVEAAQRSGQPLKTFVRPLLGESSWKLEQIRIAKAPTQSTIDRVRALIEGKPLPPTARVGNYRRGDFRHLAMTRVAAEAAGIPPSGRSKAERSDLARVTAEKARVELSRHLSDLARESRRPGQTLADRVRELRLEVAA
jgi:hypothetical protein